MKEKSVCARFWTIEMCWKGEILEKDYNVTSQAESRQSRFEYVYYVHSECLTEYNERELYGKQISDLRLGYIEDIPIASKINLLF